MAFAVLPRHRKPSHFTGRLANVTLSKGSALTAKIADMDPGHLPRQERPSMAKPVAKSYEGRRNRSRPESPNLLVIVASASFNERWPASSIHFLLCTCSSVLHVCRQIYGSFMSIIPSPNQINVIHRARFTNYSFLITTYLVSSLLLLFLCMYH